MYSWPATQRSSSRSRIGSGDEREPGTEEPFASKRIAKPKPAFAAHEPFGSVTRVKPPWTPPSKTTWVLSIQ